MGAPVWARRLGAAIAAIVILAAPAGAASASGSGGTFGTFDVPNIGMIVVAPDGSILGSDCGNARIYRISKTGTVSIFAGAGAGGFDNGYDGDGGPALDAHFGCITDLAWARDGSLIVVDHLNDVIRRIDAQGIVTTIAGSGPLFKWSHGFWRPGIKHTGDGGAATDAILDAPWGIGVDAAGSLFIADRDHDAIRRVGTDGIMTTVAGTGQRGFKGDGGPATEAKLNRPGEVAFPAGGGLLIADENNSRIRRVDTSGRITTFAGTGALGCFGNGGPAVAASLQNVGSLLVLRDGSVVASQGECNQVRVIDAAGIIHPVLGNGTDACDVTEGASALSVAISAPGGLALDAKGNLLVAVPGCQQVLRIDGSGHVHVAADLRGLGG